VEDPEDELLFSALLLGLFAASVYAIAATF